MAISFHSNFQTYYHIPYLYAIKIFPTLSMFSFYFTQVTDKPLLKKITQLCLGKSLKIQWENYLLFCGRIVFFKYFSREKT